MNVKAKVKAAFVSSALDGHTFVLDKFASLWADHLVARNAQHAAIKRSEPARTALEGLLKSDLLSQNEVVAHSAVVSIVSLLELNHEVGVDVSRSLIAARLEDKLRLLREARFDLNWLHFAHKFDGFSIVLHLISAVFDLLNGTIVELGKRAADLNDNILRCLCCLLSEASKSIAEDGLLDIRAVDGTIRLDKVVLAEDSFKVALWLLLQEVTASDFLYIFDKLDNFESSPYLQP